VRPPASIQAERGTEIERDPDLAVTQGARRQAGRAAFARVEGISKSAAAPAPLLWTAVDCSDGSISGSDAASGACRTELQIASARINAGPSVAVAPQIRISRPRPNVRLIIPSVRADAYGSSCRC
jgi:hypothetical protein